jgi:UDP-N-acetylmuramoyl-L-alanyl-D-glutamate--2,6-diaminopimelate ligase
MLADTPGKLQGNPRLGVMNRDDQSYDYLDKLTEINKVSYSIGGEGDIRAIDIQYGPDTSSFTVIGPEFEQRVETSLLGSFNVSNCLAAISATVVGLGIDPATAAAGIAAQHGVPGRMERINMGQPFMAIVDFAHTPNALRQALNAARLMTKGKLIAVFGSAGLRDREKRKLMAEVSAELADFSILTAEDPRTESLDAILAEMTAGAVSRGGVVGESVWVVPDRGEALRTAVRLSGPNDLVIACGKGHEQSMCFGEAEYPWDDRTAMRCVLAELVGVDGPEMPFLPTHG